MSEGLQNIDCTDTSCAVTAVSVWDQLRSCLVSSAIEVVGFCGRRKLDRLLENEQALSPLLANKKHVWDQVLSVGSPYTHRRFRQREHAVKRAVADAKERWVKKTAEAANVDRDGCGRWKFLKKSFRIFTMVGSQLRFLV